MKNDYLLIPLLAETPIRFVIMAGGASGGWFYRNEWAATTAFSEWDGQGAPAAGEWMDFP